VLVLTRKIGEKILIGEDISITVLDVRGDSIRLGIDAPRGVTIQRSEVVEAVRQANMLAVTSAPEDEDLMRDLVGHILPAPQSNGSTPGTDGTTQAGNQ
jgi:carbon storage regulator